MRVLDGHAVAFTTDRGPALDQTDGHAAHVATMDELARLLQERLELAAACR